MKRDATQTIWRTVVFAGAMLGAPACSKKAANTTPTNNQTTQPATTEQTPPDTTTATPAEPTPDETGEDRPRGSDDDGGGGVGRGFVLS